MRLRKASRDYIHGVRSNELEKKLKEYGVHNFAVKNITETLTKIGTKPIEHDSDPTVIDVFYSSLFPEYSGDIAPCVKIEISCLSMDEPYEDKLNTSLINQKFEDTDTDSGDVIRTVKPSRTFLEKCFLLNEEFQRRDPRSRRMSRHLYDIEKIMDTDYGKDALNDLSLYKSIVYYGCFRYFAWATFSCRPVSHQRLMMRMGMPVPWALRQRSYCLSHSSSV